MDFRTKQELDNALVAAFERIAAALENIANTMATPEVGAALKGLESIQDLSTDSITIRTDIDDPIEISQI